MRQNCSTEFTCGRDNQGAWSVCGSINETMGAFVCPKEGFAEVLGCENAIPMEEICWEPEGIREGPSTCTKDPDCPCGSVGGAAPL